MDLPHANVPDPLELLVRRYEEGERSPELLDALDCAAFAAFHAPWERPPVPRPRGVSRDLRCAQLPLEGLDEAALPLAQATTAGVPDLMMALRSERLHALRGGNRMVGLYLPYDSEADCTSQVQFRVDEDEGMLFLQIRSDLMYSHESEKHLELICAAWNGRDEQLCARVRQPEPGARRRLELVGTFALVELENPRAFGRILRCLFERAQVFWRQARERLEG